MKVGIDLGSTFSLAARVDAEGTAVLVPDAANPESYATPSVVHVARSQAWVGLAAEQLLESDPDLLVIRHFKRAFGQATPLWYGPGGEAWYPEAIAALLLRKLRYDAEVATLASVDGAVLTVPAHFDAAQREAVLGAAALAELPVLGLIDEPVAAALHYGVSRKAEGEVVLVHDFGGGTFDATVMTLDDKGAYILSRSGSAELGGKEIDDRVAAIVLDRFHRALGREIVPGARTLLELRRVAEEIKCELGLPDRRRVRRQVVLGRDAVDLEIDRAELEGAIGDLLDRAEARTVECVREAGLTPGDIGTILLVGGTTLIPAVEERMRRLFCAPGQRVIHHEPTRAVALGAALHGAQLSGEADRFRLPPELRGVTGSAIGLSVVDAATGRSSVELLLKRNMPLPAKVRRTVYTARPDQERVVLEFVQLRDPGEPPNRLGRLVVGPISPPRANSPVDVVVEYLADGTLGVTAHDPSSGREVERVFEREQAGLRQLAAQAGLVRSVTINGVIAG